MLSLAIRARIPILRARTSDIINLPQVLERLAPNMQILEARGAGIMSKADLVYTVEPVTITRAHYDNFLEAERVLLLINQGEDSPFAFDAGEVPVPKELMEEVLLKCSPKKSLKELLPAFNGLTLKGMAEVIRLTTTRDKSLTVRGVNQIRAMLTGKTQGLGQVNTELPLYLCPSQLQSWVTKNRRFFLQAPDPRLVPRGILLSGEPGTGKSQASKYISNEWGVPLYRLDIASAGSKWVFESEANVARLLSVLDQEEPAIMLVDEAEKIFSETEDQGVTARLLSQFLWWMQEHKSRVLTAMTTNNKSALPKELYRPGRIDTVMEMEKLDYKDALELCVVSLKQFLDVKKEHVRECEKALKRRTADHPVIAHAEVVQLSIDLLKEHGWIQF